MTRKKIADGERWGRWVYRAHKNSLCIEEPPQDRYNVDLDRCDDQVEVLDWIVHMSRKYWVTDADLANLVRALDACLGIIRSVSPPSPSHHKL